MVGKLIKHEFRATSKIMWPIYAGMTIVALLARYAAFPILDGNSGFIFNAISIVIIIGFFAGMFALAFAPLVVSGARFKKNILGNEGYLTMTLPATSHQILSAKLITSAVWYALTGVLALLIFIMMLSLGRTEPYTFNLNIANVIGQLRNLPSDSWNQILHIVLIGFEFVLNVVVCILLATLIVYASYAIGFSANKHKSLFTVLLIYGFFHFSAWAGIGVLLVFGSSDSKWNSFETGVSQIELFGIWTMVIMLVMCAVYYLITNYFITRKLNLE